MAYNAFARVARLGVQKLARAAASSSAPAFNTGVRSFAAAAAAESGGSKVGFCPIESFGGLVEHGRLLIATGAS